METPPTIITTTSKWKFGENHSARLLLFCLAFVATASFCLRWFTIQTRPMHADEAVHAVILGKMLETGAYRYNPTDSHGPLLYFISYPVLRMLAVSSLSEMQAWHLRIVPAVTGWFMISSLYLWRELFPASSLIISALLLAISAPVIHYEGYFIHEIVFVLLSLTLLNLASRVFASSTLSPTILAWIGIVLGLLFATKETAPIACLAVLGSAALVYRTEFVNLLRALSLKHLCAVIIPFLIVFILFYTSFGLNPQGLADWCEAQVRFVHRAGGEGHEKPVWTYLTWLLWPSHFAIPWSGVSVILSLVSLTIKLPQTVRLVAVYVLITGLIYSLIPYKTPWLELNFLVPATLPAGYAFTITTRYFANMTGKSEIIFLVSLLILGTALLGQETRALCFENSTDDRNPLAYSPTVTDVLNLEKALEPYPNGTALAVITPDYWPLPWYLRRFKQVGYWNDMAEAPKSISFQVVITSPEFLPQVQTRLTRATRVRYFGLRPQVLVVLLTTP